MEGFAPGGLSGWTYPRPHGHTAYVGGVVYPTRDDVVIVRRSGERHEIVDVERRDVHTFGGELLGRNFLTRDAAEAAARRIAQERGVAVFCEHDAQGADSTLQVIAVFGSGGADGRG